jgi:predicted HTH domain antitoxin
MCELTVTVPDARLSAINVPPEQAAEEVRMLAAVKLYELGRLSSGAVSSGAAARLAGISRVDFLSRIGNYGVATFQHTEEDLLDQIRNA